MDFFTAYTVMALLMMAYVAWVDPIPRMHGLAYDLILYTLLGVFWPLTWLCALFIYFRDGRNYR